MVIASSNIGMDSARTYTSVSASSLTMSTVTTYGNTVTATSSSTDGLGSSFSELLSAESSDSTESTELSDFLKSVSSSRQVTDINEIKAREAIRQQCIQYLIYWLFGGKDKDAYSETLSNVMDNMDSAYKDAISAASGSSNWSIGTSFMTTTSVATYQSYFGESEKTSFSTVGTVVTADGTEINFNLTLNMSRSFEEYYESSSMSQIVQFVDPLVINLDTCVASVSDQTFEFDLDCDGILETIHSLSSGSGYLALDLNGDGVINDGSELFGTSSGDGFADLAIYDEDGNGWIDENDEIFSKLMIWCKDENGNDVLYSLKEAGVGAIYLSKASTEFSLNDLKTNTTNAQIKSTGIFLYENGSVGTLQQVDLAV